MILSRIRRIWRPEIFHGYKKGQFEGWYYKIVDNESRNVWAIIVGISISKDKATDIENQSHSFIQIYNGVSGNYYYYKYDLSDFEASSDSYYVKIGENEFSINKIKLNIKESNNTFIGELEFQNIVSWPVKLLNPGAMGPFAFIPKMECYHGILSFDHTIKGSLNINGKEIDFTDGRGFISKEWGTSHPSSWIWIQSNHFENSLGTSLNVSIARVPYLKYEFPGFIIGFLHQGELYRFTNYNRSKLIDLEISKNQVSFTVKKGKNILNISALQSKGTKLKSPIEGAMSGNVIESLTSIVNVKLLERNQNNIQPKIIFEGTGDSAGFEIKGNTDTLLS